MSLFSNKQMRIIFIYCVIIILVICGIITARHKKTSSDSIVKTTKTNNETSESSDTQHTSDNTPNTDRLPPYNSSNQGNGIGGGAIMGNCSIGSRKLPIYCVDLSKKTKLDTSKKYVSISFDAAWGDEDSYPDKVLEIYNRGHDLGNHSQNHKEMSKLSVNEQKDEIMSVANKIKEITGYTSFLFRPPYGDYNSTLIDTVYGCNFYPIEWDVDSLDWKDYGTDNIIKTVTTHKALKNGSIILMHNGAKYTAEALESVITGLQSQGYEIVPISQLINTENFHMDGTGLQIPD